MNVHEEEHDSRLCTTLVSIFQNVHTEPPTCRYPRMCYRTRDQGDNDDKTRVRYTHVDHYLFSDLMVVSMFRGDPSGTSYIEDANERPIGLCDRLIRLFSVSYPAIIIVNRFVRIPSTVLERRSVPSSHAR